MFVHARPPAHNHAPCSWICNRYGHSALRLAQMWDCSFGFVPWRVMMQRWLVSLVNSWPRRYLSPANQKDRMKHLNFVPAHSLSCLAPESRAAAAAFCSLRFLRHTASCCCCVTLVFYYQCLWIEKCCINPVKAKQLWHVVIYCMFRFVNGSLSLSVLVQVTCFKYVKSDGYVDDALMNKIDVHDLWLDSILLLFFCQGLIKSRTILLRCRNNAQIVQIAVNIH